MGHAREIWEPKKNPMPDPLTSVRAADCMKDEVQAQSLFGHRVAPLTQSANYKRLNCRTGLIRSRPPDDGQIGLEAPMGRWVKTFFR
jgi:hypothetical protein